jgi:hypothetical protein
MVKQHFLEYEAAYINFEYQFPKHGNYNFYYFPLDVKFWYANLTHDKI